MPRLRRHKGDGPDLAVRGRTVLGRSDECEITLADESCSRQHAEIVETSTGFEVRDLGSSNGTFVNGEKVEGSRTLADGDHLRVGSTNFTFFATEADFLLRFVAGERKGEDLPLASERTTLGRRPNNAATFKDIKVSGVHLEVVREGGHFVLRDLGSTNGTMLEGRKVEEVVLSHGDRVQLGEQQFLFWDVREAAPSAVVEDEEAAPPAASQALSAVPRRSRGGLLGLLGVVALLGVLGWYFFLRAPSTSSTGVAETVVTAPSGSLFEEDYSFETSAAALLWQNVAGSDALGPSVASATTGSRALVGELSDGELCVLERSPVSVRPGSAYRLVGQLAADRTAHLGVSVVFLGSRTDSSASSGGDSTEGEESESVREPTVRRLDVAVFSLDGGDGSYQERERVVVAPRWAKQASVVVAARGPGEVRLDDLSLESTTAPAATKIGTIDRIDRGGSLALDHDAALVEFFQPIGTWQSAEGDSTKLPAAAFSVEFEVAGAEASWKIGRHRPDHLLLELEDSIVPIGVVLKTASGSLAMDGPFEAEGVRALVCGPPAERMELILDPPSHLRAMLGDHGLEVRVDVPPSSLRCTVRSGFSAEQGEASSLLVEAKEERRAGRLGVALEKLRRLQDELPYSQVLVDEARTQSGEILRELESRRAAVESEAEAAEFLDSLERYRQVLEAAGRYLAAVEGSEPDAELVARVDRIRERVTALESERHEAEAARIRRLHGALQRFEALDRSATVRALEEALESTYSDTNHSNTGADGSAAKGGS